MARARMPRSSVTFRSCWRGQAISSAPTVVVPGLAPTCTAAWFTQRADRRLSQIELPLPPTPEFTPVLANRAEAVVEGVSGERLGRCCTGTPAPVLPVPSDPLRARGRQQQQVGYLRSALGFVGDPTVGSVSAALDEQGGLILADGQSHGVGSARNR